MLSKTLCGKMSKEIIDKLEIVIRNTLLHWRNLQLSTKMVKVHGIEYNLLNKMKKYNGIGCFIEDFIEQSYQFGMIDERRTANMRDRVKASIDYSKMESISLNSEVKSKIKQVTINTRRTRNKRKLGNIISRENRKIQSIRDVCIKNSAKT